MSELAAVIVENRPNINLNEVIERHMKFLPDYTKLYVINDVPVSNIEDYNKLLTSVEFWHGIKEENILIFQSDSALLRTGIEEFYQWSYVGAPWKFQYNGGNGGLSFRKKSAMLYVLEHFNRKEGVNEDIFFCNCLQACSKNLAPRSVCLQFSCETIYQKGTLGYHAIEKYLSTEEINQIKNQYK